jgi:hypothetical protein
MPRFERATTTAFHQATMQIEDVRIIVHDQYGALPGVHFAITCQFVRQLFRPLRLVQIIQFQQFALIVFGI